MSPENVVGKCRREMSPEVSLSRKRVVERERVFERNEEKKGMGGLKRPALEM